MNIDSLRYPIGKPNLKEDQFDQTELNQWINTIENFPKQITEITRDLSNEQLQWKYRPEGWNIQQLVHHCADSHMNAFVRTKRALTENNPQVGPYQEALWAEQNDVADIPIGASIQILNGLHQRWAHLMSKLSVEDYNKTYDHQGAKRQFKMGTVLSLYDWHCRHHFAHVEQALKAAGSYN